MSDDAHDPRGRTDDHVFWRARGGHAKVGACRECNSRIGHEIEGRLVRGDELYAHRRRRGTLSDEDHPEHSLDVEVDLASGDVRFLAPVTKRTDGGATVYTVTGTCEQVLEVLARGLGEAAGLTQPEWEHLVADAPGRPWPGCFRFEVRHDIGLARRLAAKVLLGAGMMADPAFALTDLAGSLRAVLWDELCPIQLAQSEALAATAAVFDLPGLHPSPLHDPASEAGEAWFVPMPARGAWMVFVRFDRQTVAGSGFVVEGAWPLAQGMPVLVRDGPGGGEVRVLYRELVGWVSSQQ